MNGDTPRLPLESGQAAIHQERPSIVIPIKGDQALDAVVGAVIRRCRMADFRRKVAIHAGSSIVRHRADVRLYTA